VLHVHSHPPHYPSRPSHWRTAAATAIASSEADRSGGCSSCAAVGQRTLTPSPRAVVHSFPITGHWNSSTSATAWLHQTHLVQQLDQCHRRGCYQSHDGGDSRMPQNRADAGSRRWNCRRGSGRGSKLRARRTCRTCGRRLALRMHRRRPSSARIAAEEPARSTDSLHAQDLHD